MLYFVVRYTFYEQTQVYCPFKSRALSQPQVKLTRILKQYITIVLYKSSV